MIREILERVEQLHVNTVTLKRKYNIADLLKD